MKTCARCKQEKPLDEFPLDPQRRDGRYSYCETCKAEYMRAHRIKRRLNGTLAQENLLRSLRKFGVTLEWWSQKMLKQGEACLICRGTATGNHKRLVVDHNHETGLARGVLCGTCNTAIGLLKDDPELLRRAARYIEREGDI